MTLDPNQPQNQPPYQAPPAQPPAPSYAVQPYQPSPQAYYGAPNVYAPGAYLGQQRPTNGFALASLILAIFGICVGIIPFFIGLFLSFAPCVLGIVFGSLGIARSKRIGGYGFGMALAGLIIAGVNFLLYFTGYGIIW